MKDSFYFSHDYIARNDPKIKKLIMKHGMGGYGIFWAIIEDLYQNTNVLRLEYDSISFDLRTDVDTVKSIINDFDLFTINEDSFSSMSVQRRLEEREQKSIKARKSISSRWNNVKENTNVIRNEYERNTIKEKKRKEKENIISINTYKEGDFVEKEFSTPEPEIENLTLVLNDPEEKEKSCAKKEKKEKFAEKVKSNENYKSEAHGKIDDPTGFIEYWTESGELEKLLRYEREKTFDLNRRLKQWEINQAKFARTKPGYSKTIQLNKDPVDILKKYEEEYDLDGPFNNPLKRKK